MLIAAMVLGLSASLAWGQARPDLERDAVSIHGEESRLLVLRDAPVPFSTLERLMAGLGRPLPEGMLAARLVRAVPPETVAYVLCVSRDGMLIVGQQVFGGDPAARGSGFRRGEIVRAYVPLDSVRPWAWLVTIPVSREVETVLEVQATGDWPVQRVTIEARRVR